MTRIIAVSNQKGGVGKTTTAMNLGSALEIAGYKVLLVDLDPQANLSAYLGFEEDGNPTINDLMTSVVASGSCNLRQSIRHSKHNRLDYIPSDINLANADFYLAGALSRETVLKRILRTEAIKSYDFVLIDCLPSLGILLMNAFAVSDKILIPVQAQKFALDGLTMLTNIAKQISETINPSLDLIGVVATMVDSTNMSRDTLKTLSERYGDRMFKTVIRRLTEAPESVYKQESLCIGNTRLGEEYKQLAEELLDRFSLCKLFN